MASRSPMVETFGEEMAMELLTMLSPRPAPRSLIKGELIIDDQQLDNFIAILRANKFKVMDGALRGVRHLWIAEIGWKAAEAAAAGYLNRVDPD